MERNEQIQWTIVAIVFLIAIVWAAIRIVKLFKKNGTTQSKCGCCSASDKCDLKEIALRREKSPESCHDGQSAKN